MIVGLAGLLTGCPMEEDLEPVPVIVNGTDQGVTVVLVREPGSARPGQDEQEDLGQLEPGDEMPSERLRRCVSGDDVLVAETAAGDEVDRWNAQDCPDGEVPDEWVIRDDRPEQAPEP